MITGCTLFLGDCLEEMDRIEAGSIDAIIADLPYGTTACKWDVVIPFEPLWMQFKRVIKKRGAVVLFGSQPFTSMLVMSNPAWFKYEWVWDKAQSGNARGLAKYQPLKVTEDICVFSRGSHTYIPQMRKGKLRKKNGTGKLDPIATGLKHGIATYNDVYYPTNILYFPNCGNKSERQHETEKPIALLEYLVLTYTNPGELVLDCTMGSGTTGAACIRTGRRFIGIEKDPTYFETAKNRLAAEAAKLNNTDLPMFQAVNL